MKRIVALIFLIFGAQCAFAQSYGQMQFQLNSAQGQAISGATINVYTQSACGVAAGAAATLYPSANGGTALTQPLKTNGMGYAVAYAAAGCYTVVYNSAYTGTLTYADQTPAPPGGGGSGTVSGQAASTIPLGTSSSVIGNQSHINEATAGQDTFTQNAVVQASFFAKNNASIGPRYDVTQFGAVGNGITDDTTAIQSAGNACYANGGGFIEFPGAHTYAVSRTIYLYDTCSIEGVRGSAATSPPSDSSPLIYWDGPNTQGNTASVTSVVVTNNQTAGSPLVTAMDPGNRPASQLANFELAVTANNSFAANEWVEFSGCTYLGFNNVIAQVATANSTSFTAVYNGTLNTGTYSETCTAVQAQVVFAFDSVEHETDTVSNLMLNSHLGAAYNTPEDVDFYFSGRVDAGNNIYRVAAETAHFANFYYAAGAEELKIMDGSRSDTSDYYEVYFRNHGTDKITIVNSQFGPNTPATHGASTAGGMFLIDNEACAAGQATTLTLDHMVGEDEVNMTSGLADITFLQCPTSVIYPQFKLNMVSSGIVSPASVTGVTNVQVLPASDTALATHIIGSELGNNLNTTNIITGVPSISLYAQFNLSGWISDFHYFPSLKSWLGSGSEFTAYNQPAQILGDLYLQNLWQFSVPASLWLESDTGFAALPSGTTEVQGNVLAPPAYFNCGTGSGCGRYAVDVVQSPGTVGTLNGGSTTCSAAATPIITCNSGTGLMIGQYITTPTNTTRIVSINAVNPSAVLVTTGNMQGTYTNQAISYGAPTLGKEIQLPTKFSAAPSAGTWAQGDIVWNSGVTSGGTCYWINTAAGTPGTWLAVPCAGGFSNPMTTLGDTIYGGASGTPTRLAGSTSASTLCLTQTGTGSVSAAPAWGACSGSSATAFSAITGSMNTTAAMVVGTGASIATSGTGAIAATSVPFSGLTGATTNNSLSNGNLQQTLQWDITSALTNGLLIDESTPSTGSGNLVFIQTGAGSTITPLNVADNLTGSQTLAALRVNPLWNTTGVVDAGILENITNTASGTGSLLLDLQVGGTSQLKVDKVGNVTAAGAYSGAGTGLTGTAGSLSIGGQAGSVANSVTFSNSGSGDASGAAYNGSASHTISYNTIGAAPALSACTDESTNFTPASGQCYFVTAATSQATPAASAFVVFTITTSSAGSAALTGTTIADGGSCSSYISGTTLTLTASQTVTIKSDGTNIRANCTAASAGGVTWPATHDVVISNSTSSPNGAAPGTSGRMLLDQGASADPAFEAMSGDCTLTLTGAITCTKTSGTSFSGLATLAETDGDIIFGSSGAWTKGTALPSGITAITQSGGDDSTKVATTAYVDAHFIANGTAALGTSAISSGACATVVTVSATGVATTDVISLGFNGDPTAVTGYGASATGAVLSIYPYPSANNINIKVCNSTGASITPGSMTLNWKVTR